MNDSSKDGYRPRVSYFFALALIVTLLVSAGLTHGARVSNTTHTPDPPMKQFVFLFRQDQSKQLSEADQKRRAEEVRTWAIRQNNEGRKLDPRILTGQNHRVNPDNQSGPATADEGVVVAITFLEAHDFAEAVKIAETHPGLHYGVSVE